MWQKILISIILACMGTALYAQKGTGIKGVVTDRASALPIEYANVIVLNDSIAEGSITDSLGYFHLKGLKVGRYDIKVSYMGYEPYIAREIFVGSGKEVFLEVALKENAWTLDEVVVTPELNKGQPINKMALASARMFSVEEANRYAGGLDDPARLVSSFAGVAGSIGNNGITVRGNSPQFLQWNLEGVEIPNPTHFPDVTGIGGGILTALSSQVLGNSDFFTGAFPAEYANALSGIFDMKLRVGNNQNYENTFQLGTIGIDFAAEGPFKKGKRSSFLFNYRYSTLGLLDQLTSGGLGEAGGLRFQDLSFKLHFPTSKAGVFTVWGIGTIDRYSEQASEDITKWETEDDRISNKSRIYMGAIGLGYKVYLNEKSYLQANAAATFHSTDLLSKRSDTTLVKKTDFKMKGYNLNLILNACINTKFSARHTNRSGFNLKGLFFDIDYNMRYPNTSGLVNFARDNGNTALLGVYTNSNIELSKTVTANIGINGNYFFLNKSWTLEPRISLKWQNSPTQSFALAYGLHSRHEKVDYYFVKSESGELVNKRLDFTKAHHIVLAYDKQLTNNIHLKIEPYFQYLYDVPVILNNYFSIINHRLWYLNDPLTSKGEGVNYGLDITLERYMNNGFYYMLTGSVFNSRYKGGDRVWRNTRLNRNFLFNILGGKEWYIGKEGRNVLGVNLRFSFMGGERYSPVHPDATPDMVIDRDVPPDETRIYELQQSPAFISNLTVTYKINRRKLSHEFALKLLNANGYKEFLGYTYNYRKQSFEEVKEAFVIPNISYKINF